MAEDLQFNLKLNMENAKKELEDFGSSVGNKGAGGTMGGAMYDKKAFSDPSDQAKKFVDQFGKGMESMKFDKRLDIISHLTEKMNDPGTSMQSRAKIEKRLESYYTDLDLINKNQMRKFIDKGRRAGFSKGDVIEGMALGLGEEVAGVYGSAGSNAASFGNRPAPGEKPSESNKYAQKAAAYLIGYMMADTIKNAGAMYQSLQMTEANIQQRAGTTFDMGSVMQTGLMTSAMHRENIMQGLQIRKQGYSTAGSLAGLGIGLGVGVLTGGLGLGVAPMIGSALGGEIGGIFGTDDITDEMKKQTEFIAKDKMVGQLMGIANQRVGMYDEMDTARARFRARSGTSDVGGSGTGYTQAELYGLGHQQESVTGHFNKKTFTDQLRFSRAYGYNPAEIFNAGVTTRYTGQEVGASELFSRKELAERTGMGTRMPELIQGINQLAGVMTRVGANPTESSMMQAANLPFLLFGDSARGRMGDMGMDTLMGMNSMFRQQSGSAGDAFLYQALKPKSLQEFDLMKEQGIFGQGNLRKVTEYAGQFGSSAMTERIFKGMGVESASLRKAFTDQAFNEDGTVNKDFLEKFEKIDTNTEEGTKQMADLLKVSEEAVSGAERQKKALVDAMVKTGGDIVKAVHEMQLKEVQEQNKVLENQKTWDIITEAWRKSVFDFQEAVNKLLGITSADTQKAISDFSWNMTHQDKDGLHSRDILSKLKSSDYGLEEYDLASSRRDPNSVYFDLDDPVRTDRSGSYPKNFAKRLRISAKALETFGIKGDAIEELQKIMDYDSARTTLMQKDIEMPETKPLLDNTGAPTSQGGKGHTLVFNINAATRAGIHFELDNHLDALQAMSHPSKLANNF